MPVASTGQVRRFCLKSNLSWERERTKLKPAALLSGKSSGALCLLLNRSSLLALILSGATARLWSTMPSIE